MGAALPLLLGSVLADLGLESHLCDWLFGFRFEEPDAGLVEAVGAHVAAGDGPFVVLFGQQGAGEADDGGSGGEDSHDVGPASDFLALRKHSYW